MEETGAGADTFFSALIRNSPPFWIFKPGAISEEDPEGTAPLSKNTALKGRTV